VRLIAKIQHVFGERLPAHIVFTETTIEHFASELQQRLQAR
jgi:hypothetical protein